MTIQIQQHEHEGTRILELSGRLDTETAADVELTFQDQLNAGDRDFLVDLTGIGYVSSAGLRVLLALAKQLDGGKGSLRLCGLNPSVRQVFDVAGFSKLFAIFPDRDKALGSQPKRKAAPAQPPAQSALTKQVAKLLGITPTNVPRVPGVHTVDVARRAASLLGVGSAARTAMAAAGTGAAQSLRAVAPRRPAPAPPAPAPAPGLLGKFRGLFGGRK